MHISVPKDSFSTSSCASSLLRVLIDGNPRDRTQDQLSEMILNAFDSVLVGSSIGVLVFSLTETAYSTVDCTIPALCIRWSPRLCSLGDLLAIVCKASLNATNILASSLSDQVLEIFAESVGCERAKTLAGSAQVSLLYLCACFADNTHRIAPDENGKAVLLQQRKVKEKLLIRASGSHPILEASLAQGSSADMVHRALKLQHLLLSMSDERALAVTLAKASCKVAKKEQSLCIKLEKSAIELKQLTSKYEHIEADRDKLFNALQDQRFAHERRLEWTRSEAQMAARHVSEIHVQERRQAECLYNQEKELRTRTESANEQLTHEISTAKSRIEQLEKQLELECKARQHFETSLGGCKDELATASFQLERITHEHNELKKKYVASEQNLAELSAVSEDAKANLEETCGKLIQLSIIYLRKETDMEKYKVQLRSALNTSNQQADTALQKYESAKQRNKTLTKKLAEVSNELNELKAHRADVQRMRKNAPTSYINQMHHDPRIKGKKDRPGKENVGRSQR